MSQQKWKGGVHHSAASHMSPVIISDEQWLDEIPANKYMVELQPQTWKTIRKDADKRFFILCEIMFTCSVVWMTCVSKVTNIDIVHGCHFLDKFIGKDAIKVGYIHTYIQIYIAPKSWERILGAVVIICLWLVFVIWYLYMTCYKFLTESNSERILKIGAIFGEVMGKS